MKLFKRAETETEEILGASDQEALLRSVMEDAIITREEAMMIPTVATCVNKISESISTLPVKLYRIENDTKIEIKEDSRVKLLNDDTGDVLNGTEFKRAMIRDYLMGKGGYAYLNKVRSEIKSIHYVKEQEVTFLFNQDPIFKDYDIMIQGTRYRPYHLLKILRNTENGREGKSIVEESNRILSIAFHMMKFEDNLVRTGGNKKGFIKSAKKLTEPSMNALKSAWNLLYRNNSENVMILNDSMDFKESSNTLVEMQLNENKKTNNEEICKLFHMPLGIASGTATEEEKIEYVQRCLNSVINEFECSLNRDLLFEKEKGSYFFAFDISDLTKGDIEKRYKAYEIASKNGFMQTDEIRFRENLPSLGLDFIKLGLQDVLYDVKTGNIYIPNMDSMSNIKDGRNIEKGKEKDEDRDQE